MSRSCRQTCLKMEGNKFLNNQGFEANLELVSAYDPVLAWASKFLRVLPGLPSTDF